VPLPLNAALPEREARVAVVGNPAGAQGVVSTGRIFAILQMPGYGPLLQITAPIANGSSGSPVLNDKKEVIGVATFQLTSTENFNFAIPAARVSALLAKRQEAPREITGQDADALPASDFERAKRALQANDYGQALSLFQALLEKEESAEQSGWRGWEIWFYIGRSHGGLGRHGEAVTAFQKAADLMPDLAVIHYNLGVAYLQTGAYDLATASFQRATGLYPDMAEAHFNRGMICILQQDAQCTRDTLDILRRINPDLAGLYLRRLHGDR
jgi:tetratricopeptide (TPR) repeat protein